MNRSTQKYWVVKTLSSKQTVVRMRHQAWTNWIYIVYFIIRENNKPRQYLLKVTNKHCSISLFIKFSNLKSPSSHNSPFPALRAVKNQCVWCNLLLWMKDQIFLHTADGVLLFSQAGHQIHSVHVFRCTTVARCYIEL